MVELHNAINVQKSNPCQLTFPERTEEGGETASDDESMSNVLKTDTFATMSGIGGD